MYRLIDAAIDVLRAWGWLAAVLWAVLIVLAGIEVYREWQDTDNSDQENE